MPKEIGFYDAKIKLPEILKRVEAGESLTITNRGKPVADVIPTRAGNHLKTQAAIENILATKKHIISDDAFLELKSYGRK